jgi:pimeloyl-ACP methyl ester carboxylesterase
VVTEFELALPDGGTLHAYDTGGADRMPVFWHHGTPNIGAPPAPLFAESQRLGLRWLSYDRPGYGGSTRRPGRDIASAATYVSLVADALGIERFALFGHSGGGTHALGCAAALGDRVTGVVSGAALAPRDADGLDWFAGMVPSGVAALNAAAEGLAAKERYESSGVEYDPSSPSGTWPRWPGTGPGLTTSSVQPWLAARAARSTMTSPTCGHGVWNPAASPPRCSCCTVAGTGSSRPPTAVGWPSGYRRRTYACRLRMDTSRSSRQPARPSSGCGPGPIRAPDA